MSEYYINYKKISVKYDTENHLFECNYSGRGRVISARVSHVAAYSGQILHLNESRSADARVRYEEECARLSVHYDMVSQGIVLEFMINHKGLHISSYSCHGASLVHDSDFYIQGNLFWGTDMENSTFAVSLGRMGSDLRVANGPASSIIDNALFDRLTDSVIEITGHTDLKIFYDWEYRSYGFLLKTGRNWYNTTVSIAFTENYYANQFHIPYRPINKKGIFTAPPAGWMSWYALMFNSSEDTVLENARLLSEKFKPYGANCVWVDWEWYHSNFAGTESEGVNMFSPNKKRYPRGLKYVADEIKKLGLVPALWIGATCDTNKNKVLEDNPDLVLANEKAWCGQWWLDISHPDAAEKYIPMVFKQIMDWGYEAIKWDCLPITLEMADKYHYRFHNSEKSTEEAFREVVRAARKTIGDNVYMMSCSGENYRAITAAMDCFDGARIGGDVFKWDEFIKNAFERIRKYLCFNNIVLYSDPDVVILREEFNNIEQAKSRASFVSVAGLPYTIGDNLPDLDNERMEIIKRTIPVSEVHPMDLNEICTGTPVAIINQAIARPYENWNVADVFNTTAAEKNIVLNLGGDLHLETGENIEYLVYEYWRQEFLGCCRENIPLKLAPYESKVLSVRRKANVPQILSTSRHITQGACELCSVKWDENECTLYGRSRMVRGDSYTLVLYVPEYYEPILQNNVDENFMQKYMHPILQVFFKDVETGILDWQISFEQTKSFLPIAESAL